VSDDRRVAPVLSLLALPVVALMALTGRGQLGRGGRVATALLAGVFFPVTWVAWYVVDRRRAQRTGAASDSRTAWS
jgi:hypothetical protein